MADKNQTPHKNRADLLFRWLTAFCAIVVILVIAGLVFELARNSVPAFEEFGFGFLISDNWDPLSRDFGAAGSVYGTIVSTIIAMLLAVPISLAIALFLVESAPPFLSRIVGGGIELLAAIPSIIYGMWGLFVLAPVMREHVQPLLGDTLGFLPLFQGPPLGIGMLTAGIILALMILPYISAVSRDVLGMVPRVIKESAYGVGATTWEVTRKVSLRYGMRGIVGAMFLGLGRAIGETMAVTFVIGNSAAISASLFAPSHTIASTLANEFAEAVDPLYSSSLIALGLVLFAITLLFQAGAHFWLRHLRKRLEG
jgi:phosphate transport system permease protein